MTLVINLFMNLIKVGVRKHHMMAFQYIYVFTKLLPEIIPVWSTVPVRKVVRTEAMSVNNKSQHFPKPIQPFLPSPYIVCAIYKHPRVFNSSSYPWAHSLWCISSASLTDELCQHALSCSPLLLPLFTTHVSNRVNTYMHQYGTHMVYHATQQWLSTSTSSLVDAPLRWF